jgi:very-short-patch-repair endonuclease
VRHSNLPSALLTEPFLVRDAVQSIPYERLRQPGIVLLARGLRASSPIAAQARIDPLHFVRLLGSHQHFSHTTAASLWGMPVPATSSLHTTTVGDGSVTRRPGFVGHRVSLERADVDQIRGIPVSSRVGAWAECSTLVPLDDLVAMGDFLVGTKCGHDREELVGAVTRRAGARGTRILRQALDLVCVGAESQRETRLRLQLLREGFRLPLLNCTIHDDHDRFVARSDIVFGRERVVVEYDGDKHRTDRKTFRNDKRRREALADAGWHALSLSDDDLSGDNWTAFVSRLRRALARGEAARLGHRSGPPPP